MAERAVCISARGLWLSEMKVRASDMTDRVKTCASAMPTPAENLRVDYGCATWRSERALCLCGMKIGAITVAARDCKNLRER